jgi:type IV pilus assembly protein PilV
VSPRTVHRLQIPATTARPCRANERGMMLIEVLVAMLVCAFGLLGFVAMQARASIVEAEALQRGQALVLMQDMVSRINANRAAADSYVTAGVIGAGAIENCAGKTGAQLDVCEWGNLLRGESESRGGASVGAMVSARGCITKPATSNARYVVSVAWLGNSPTGAPVSSCGQGDDAYANEALRRAVSNSVCIGWLQQPDPLPAVPAC